MRLLRGGPGNGRPKACLVLAALTFVFGPAPEVWAQWQKNEYQLQKEAAALNEPDGLFVERQLPKGAPVEVMRLRFYGDDDFRSGSGLRWQDRMRAQLGQLNQVLEPAFGVRLEAESFRRWERKGASGALNPMLEELERLDKGADVDWVVGLVGPLPLVSMSFHDLGVARILGKHFVLRSMQSIAELDEFNRIFRALDREQREALYGRRKAHKELGIFLHELGHTLGAFHVNDPKRIMGPGYSPRTSLLNAADAGLLAEGFAARIAARGRDTVDWKGLYRFIADHPAHDWLPNERAELAAVLSRSPVRPAVPSDPLPAPPSKPVPAPKAAVPPKADFLAEAEGHLRANRRPEALAALAHGTQSLAGKTGMGGTWVAVARFYADLGAYAAADEALAAAGNDPGVAEIADELVRRRRVFGVPKAGAGWTVAGETEPDYVAAVRRVRNLLATQQMEGAARASAEELRRFPSAPGLLVLTCEIGLMQNRPREAATACKKALAGMEELPRAHYLEGLLFANAGKFPAAIKSLRRAVELWPEEAAYGNALVQVLRASGREREAQAFESQRQKPPPAAAPSPPSPPPAKAPAPAPPPGPPKTGPLPPSAFTPVH